MAHGKLTICLLLLFVLLFAADLEAQKQRIRITVDQPALMYVLPRGLDICGRGPGYVDAIVDAAMLSAVQRTRLPVAVLDHDVEAKLQSLAADYHSFPSMVSELQNIAATYPGITNLTIEGQSYQNRDIHCLEISDNPGIDEGEAEVLFIGLHHAREWPSLEICLFICNELTSNYGSDPTITDMVNNRRIFVIPCMNPDGYVYCHDQGHDWRKNRHYFSQYGTYGVDLNRNYGGTTNGVKDGDWGSVGSASVTHYPDQSTYCGPAAFSEPETQVIRDFILDHDLVAGITYHTYSELVLWPWGYSGSAQTLDDTLLKSIGQGIASRITPQSGYGSYSPTQSAGLYPTTGDTTDWTYGHGFYVEGKNPFFYTVEACNEFHPSYSKMQQVMEENFDGAFYLVEQADTIRSSTTPWPLPANIDAPAFDQDGNYTVSWTEINPAAGVDRFELEELSDLAVVTDDAESGGGLWNLSSFSVSTSRYHSSNHSFRSHSSSYTTGSMTTIHPIAVDAGDQLTFWTWYDIENLWDYAVAEVSLDGRKWDDLELFTGSSGGWKQKSYALDTYAGQSIYIRFLYTTDAATLEEGFYVDDIHPVADFGTVKTLSSSITQDHYDVTGNGNGDYYYRVKARSTVHGWADFSILDKTTVDTGGAPSFSVTATPVSTIIPRGTRLEYDVAVTNIGTSAASAAAWTEVFINAGPFSGNPVFGPYPFTLQPAATGYGNISHNVPSTAPLGNIYELFFHVGDYPGTSYANDSFTFEVVP